jgi:multiple sugar transport system substrate-binding protein
MKRLTGSIAALTLLGVTAGCGGSTPSGSGAPAAGTGGDTAAKPKGDKQITVLYVGDQFWQDQAKEFEKATGIKVKYEVVAFPQQHDKLATTFAGGGSDYDVVHVRDDYISEFAPKGFLTPLDSMITDNMKTNIPKSFFEPLTYGGKTYAFPRYLWPWQFYYNKDLFQKAGIEKPPATWDEFVTVAQKLVEKGITPFAEPLNEKFSYTPFIVHLRANGGEFWDYTKDVPTFNSPEGVASLKFMADMYKNKLIDQKSISYDNTAPLADAFSQGTIAMMMNAPHTFFLTNNPETSKIVGKAAVGLIPGAKAKTASYSETGGLGIPASSKNKEAAMEYIKFVTSTEQEKAMAISLSRVPADKVAVADPEVIKKNPHFEKVGEQLASPYGMFRHEKATLISTEVSKHITAAIIGKETPEEALKAAEQAALKAIGK